MCDVLVAIMVVVAQAPYDRLIQTQQKLIIIVLLLLTTATTTTFRCF